MPEGADLADAGTGAAAIGADVSASRRDVAITGDGLGGATGDRMHALSAEGDAVVVPAPLAGDSDGIDRGTATPVRGPLGPGESEKPAAAMPTVTRAVGAGDADDVQRGSAKPVKGPLGAGETDPRSKVTEAAPVKGPEAPGDGPESEYEMRPPRALGPGDLQVPQSATRVKRR